MKLLYRCYYVWRRRRLRAARKRLSRRAAWQGGAHPAIVARSRRLDRRCAALAKLERAIT